MDAAKQVLASKGAKLRVAEMHLRRIADGKFIARHDLRDGNGRPPMDGQSESAEYSLNNPAELAAHVAQHMAPPDDDADDTGA